MIPNILFTAGAGKVAATSPDAAAADAEPGFAGLLDAHLGGEASAAGAITQTTLSAKELAQHIREILESGKMPDGLALESGQAQQLQQWLAQLTSGGPQSAEKGDALLAKAATREAAAAADGGLLLKGMQNGQSDGANAVSPSVAAGQAPTSGTAIPALVTSPLDTEKRRHGNEQIAQPETAALQAKAVRSGAADNAGASALAQDTTAIQTHANATHEASPLNAALLRLAPEGNVVTHANALATASANAAPVLSQPVGTAAWQQALSQQVTMFTRNGIHNAELRLHPQELGALQLNIRMSQEQAQLHIVSENHYVRAALEAAMPQLRTALAEAGIALNQSSVSADNAAPWQQAGQEQNGGGQGGGQHGGNEGFAQEEGDNTAAEIRSIARPGGVDTFA
ncbi:MULTISPECIES: flagellar hook-length control protein FliK [Tenebrionibacter/Tenebrionicola group]|jgi:flagellar hook-length control protein FliK|nr:MULTISPECIES: flagellar hook-length control protein FliK [Tenebrionibacter/Tenebrionicola group]